MEEIITASVLFVVSLCVFVLSIRSFQGKGFLLNNAYIYASKKERAEMNKKPYYRQTAVVFFLMSIMFLFLGFAIFMDADWITHIVKAIVLIILIYAIASSIAIEKGKKQR